VRCLALALAVLSLSLVSHARALTLHDLNAGSDFVSGDGSLSFSFDPGSVVLNGSLPGTLMDYLVNFRERMGRAGRERALALYPLEKAAQRLAELCHSLARGASQGSRQL
jgi:hypothetical protein